jgi:hypothetical protein
MIHDAHALPAQVGVLATAVLAIAGMKEIDLEGRLL